MSNALLVTFVESIKTSLIAKIEQLVFFLCDPLRLEWTVFHLFLLLLNFFLFLNLLVLISLLVKPSIRVLQLLRSLSLQGVSMLRLIHTSCRLSIDLRTESAVLQIVLLFLSFHLGYLVFLRLTLPVQSLPNLTVFLLIPPRLIALVTSVHRRLNWVFRFDLAFNLWLESAFREFVDFLDFLVVLQFLLLGPCLCQSVENLIPVLTWLRVDVAAL